MKSLIKILFLTFLIASCTQKGNLLSSSLNPNNLGSNPQDDNGNPGDPNPPSGGGGAIAHTEALFVATYNGREAIFEIKDNQSIVKHVDLPEHSNLTSAVLINDKIYYTLAAMRFDATGVSEVYELSLQDGSSKKISQFHQNNTSGVASVSKSGTELWASVRANSKGFEIYKYAAGQWSQVLDIESGVVGSYPAFFQELNNKLYFTAYQKASGMELWNNQSGAAIFANLITGQSSSHAMPWFTANGKIYLTSKSGTTYELMSVTEAGVSKIEVQGSGSAEYGSNPLSVIAYKGGFAGSCLQDSSGREFCSAATGTTSWKVQDIATGTASSNPRFLVNYKDEVYFQAQSTQGTELYKSNGNSFQLVKDIYSGSSSSYPENLWVFGEKLYFSASDSQGGSMYSFDGVNVVKITLNQQILQNSRSLLNPSR